MFGLTPCDGWNSMTARCDCCGDTAFVTSRIEAWTWWVAHARNVHPEVLTAWEREGAAIGEVLEQLEVAGGALVRA